MKLHQKFIVGFFGAILVALFGALIRVGWDMVDITRDMHRDACGIYVTDVARMHDDVAKRRHTESRTYRDCQSDQL